MPLKFVVRRDVKEFAVGKHAQHLWELHEKCARVNVGSVGYLSLPRAKEFVNSLLSAEYLFPERLMNAVASTLMQIVAIAFFRAMPLSCVLVASTMAFISSSNAVPWTRVPPRCSYTLTMMLKALK